jgi:hypothetical protein
MFGRWWDAIRNGHGRAAIAENHKFASSESHSALEGIRNVTVDGVRYICFIVA